MPFKSEAQRRLMWMKHPDIAQKWVDEGAKSTGLPMHKKGKKKKKKESINSFMKRRKGR